MGFFLLSSFGGIVVGLDLPFGQVITEKGFLSVGVFLIIFCVLAVVVVKYIIFDNISTGDSFNTTIGFPLLSMSRCAIVNLTRSLLLS